MNKYLKGSIIFLILLFALLGIVVALTNALPTLNKINGNFFVLATLFFLISVFLWIISWAYLIRKHAPIPYIKLIAVGFGSLYGALTPIQLGSEALRSINLKQFFKVGYLDSVSASMIAKGAKFSILAIITAIVFLLFLIDTKMDPVLFLGFFSGFSVVILACILFLLPLKKNVGLKISSFFLFLAGYVKAFSKLSDFFTNYSVYLKKTERRSFLIVFALAFFSWIFEFLALQFSFYALNIPLMLHSLLIFMVLVSVLERTPFLPRGIGLVEFVGYHFLAFPQLIAGTTLTIGEIGAALIVYDIVRLVIPTILSIFIAGFLIKFTKKN